MALLRLMAVVGLLSLPLVGPGCGGAESWDRPAEPFGHLLIEKSLAGGPIFAEGSVTHLRVVGADGSAVVDDLHPIETMDVPLAELSLPAGGYTVTAVERPCQGNCEYLDPPARSTRCELEVVLPADRTVGVAIVLSATPDGPESSCSLAPS